MDLVETTARLAVAAGSGFLIGLQREHSSAGEPEAQRSATGGVRTYPLASLVGSLSVLLAPKLGLWLPSLALAALVIPMAISYADEVRRGLPRGMTSEAAFVVTFLIGALCGAQGVAATLKDQLVVAAGAAVLTTALLSLKHPLHEFAARLSKDDVYATLKFAVLAVVVLPLLPNQAFGPLRVLNPFHIGLMVALIAGMGFVGYVAVRLLGPGRGLGLTGFLGGFVSSTAVTLTFSGQARRSPSARSACALGVVLASTVMSLRVLAEAGVVHPPFVRALALPMAAVFASGLAAAGILYFTGSREASAAEAVRFHNPFELGMALKFGLIFAGVLFVAKAAAQYLGPKGIYLAALAAGTTDVDAITLSMAGLVRDGLDPQAASTAVFLAVGSNTVVKAVLAAWIGGTAYGIRVALAFAAMVAAGGLAILLAPATG
jgi:uncharacterized membrane protein (DUF4010 family)